MEHESITSNYQQSLDERKEKLIRFLMNVFESYTDYNPANGNEQYFTFIRKDNCIIANVVEENTEVDSFMLEITPKKRCIFKPKSE